MLDEIVKYLNEKVSDPVFKLRKQSDTLIIIEPSFYYKGDAGFQFMYTLLDLDVNTNELYYYRSGFKVNLGDPNLLDKLIGFYKMILTNYASIGHRVS